MTVRFLRSLGIASVSVLGVVGLALSGTAPSLLPVLTATTALIMGGTGNPLIFPPNDDAFVSGYLGVMVSNYLDPAPQLPKPPTGELYNQVAVITPEEFWPVAGSRTFGVSVSEGRTNFIGCFGGGSCDHNPNVNSVAPLADDTFIGVGYSQSAVIASLIKADLIAAYRTGPANSPTASFLLLSNPMRPNGGILVKFNKVTIPILDIPMYGATPTDTCRDGNDICYRTVDVAHQYDILGGDAPNNLFNIVALANSIASYVLLHGGMAEQTLADASVDQGVVGDTHYYLNPAELLPILMPLESVGVPRALLLVADAPIRVVVEQAYRRDIHPGVPTPQYLLPISNPLTLPINVLRAIPVGIDDGLQEAGLPRLLGTEPAGPYGVGGEDQELAGLPAGLIPLGAADSTPHPPTVATNDVAEQPISDEDQSAARDDSDDRKKDVKTVTKDLRSGLKKKLDNSTAHERPKPLRPKSIRPSGDRPPRKALKGVAEHRQKAMSRGSKRSVTSPANEES